MHIYPDFLFIIKGEHVSKHQPHFLKYMINISLARDMFNVNQQEKIKHYS